VRGGSRSEVSAMGDRRKCQTYTASPAEPGGLLVMLGLDPNNITFDALFTDLRSGVEKRRSGKEVQRSTFARFLGLFDFRLLQQNLPRPEVTRRLNTFLHRD
jgi:hypothetical protein